jgi:ankyrin repeat protein
MHLFRAACVFLSLLKLCQGDERNSPRPPLNADCVRFIDQLARRAQREDVLLRANNRNLNLTLRDAARAGGVSDVMFLLRSGADVNYARGRALEWAAQGGHVATVIELISAGAERISSALFTPSPDIAALLLDRGADVNWNEGYALRMAAANGFIDTSKVLVAAGADVNARDGAALRSARANGHAELAVFLFESGAAS